MVNSEIRTLVLQTYTRITKPLLTGSLAVAMTIVFVGVAYEQESPRPDLSTPKKAMQAFTEALLRNDMALAKSLALGNESQLANAKLSIDLDLAKHRMAVAATKRFDVNNAHEASSENYDTTWTKASEVIEGDKARLSRFLGPSFALEKSGPSWEIDLRSEDGSERASIYLQQLLRDANEITGKIGAGRYKSAKECADDWQAKLAAAKQEKSPGQPPSETTAEKLPEYTAAEAAKHIGENATVIGKVACVECVTGCYVSFGDCGGDATFFVHLPENPPGPKLNVDKLKGTTIAVSGNIGGTPKQPHIVAESTSQIALPKEPTLNGLETTIAREEKLLEVNPKDAKAYFRRGLAREKKADLDHSICRLPRGYKRL